LNGYYKYAPQNGDTMHIEIDIYDGGIKVDNGQILSTTTSDWTPFSIPLNNYTTADSATLIIAAYNCSGPVDRYFPHGSSVLKIDNLSFGYDVPTSIKTGTIKTSISPNPFSVETKIQTTQNLVNATLTVYSSQGLIVKQMEKVNGQLIILNRDGLASGLYLVKITQGDKLIAIQKVVII
jgi:Secretion system C-terminal sorting domain